MKNLDTCAISQCLNYLFTYILINVFIITLLNDVPFKNTYFLFFQGFTKEFGTLTALITHHSVMPELLPCPLSLSRYNPSFKKHDSEDMVDIDEDPDYNLLSDFRKMLADINV